MAENPWYSFYVGDYDQKTAHLSMLEHGAYRLLLDHYYAMRAPLQNDIKLLYRICRAFTPSERKSVAKILANFFTNDGIHYVNKRCDSEIAKLLKYINRQSAAAQLRHSHEKSGKNGKINPKSIKKQANLFHESHLSDSYNIVNNIDSHSTTAQPRARVPQPQLDKKEKKERIVGSRFALQDPPVDWINFCQTQRPDLHPGKTFDIFRDYWISKTGTNATKLDWFATWRNWVRNQKSETGGNYGQPKQTKLDLIAQGVAEARAKRKRDEHGQAG